MAKVLKVGDFGSGICHSHESPVGVTGTLVQGFAGFEMDGIRISGHNHTVQLTCGHTGKLVATVGDIVANGVPVGKLGDSWTNNSGVTTGTITNVLSGIDEG